MAAEATVAVPVQSAGPAPAAQQTSVGADVPAAIVRGTAQGVSKTLMAHVTEVMVADPPDWLRTLWGLLKGLFQ
ncbi:hypothetical protein AB0O51_19315 [Streptomyces sp. NPDC090301]|uniref:hypothetical protein n=1 Tax=Streptomyces sp. NPDC090301 TaxID=3154975 RepID=UPI00342BAAB5